MTWNFEDCVSDIFYDALKKHFPSSWHWCLYFTAVIHTFICLYGKMILCKLAGHKEIFILFMANANANLYQLILSSTLTHHFFSYCFTKVSIFMSGSSVKIMFTSCICLFSNFGNCQPEIYFFLLSDVQCQMGSYKSVISPCNQLYWAGRPVTWFYGNHGCHNCSFSLIVVGSLEASLCQWMYRT